MPLNGSLMAKMKVMIEMIPREGGYRYLLPLDCYDESEPGLTLCVRMRKHGCNKFVREDPYQIAKFNFTRPLLNPCHHNKPLSLAGGAGTRGADAIAGEFQCPGDGGSGFYRPKSLIFDPNHVARGNVGAYTGPLA